MLVGYARVSTLDQNPSLQIDALREAGCEKIFVEKTSGARKDRPQLKATLKYLRDGDTLVVWKLSRLARSLKQVIQTVQTMHARNIEFRVLTQKIDTTTPDGRLFFHITASFDQFQRELISENTRAGLLAARKHGRKGGRPRALDDDKIRLAESLLRISKTTHSSKTLSNNSKLDELPFIGTLHRRKFESSGQRTAKLTNPD